jgi:hypothetical protein
MQTTTVETQVQAKVVKETKKEKVVNKPMKIVCRGCEYPLTCGDNPDEACYKWQTEGVMCSF